MRESSNPPAFPVGCNTNPDCDAAGMTLRDWFAGMALQGMIASPRLSHLADNTPCTTPPRLAAFAYELAEAMLAERAEPANRPKPAREMTGFERHGI
jgi:hypothetical protein